MTYMLSNEIKIVTFKINFQSHLLFLQLWSTPEYIMHTGRVK